MGGVFIRDYIPLFLESLKKNTKYVYTITVVVKTEI
jgi:hypothetical protein